MKTANANNIRAEYTAAVDVSHGSADNRSVRHGAKLVQRTPITVTKLKVRDVIGERRLVFRDAPRKNLVVTLGKPRRIKGYPDWECPFRIKGPGVARFDFGYGVDAIQALTTALDGIRSMLDDIGKPLAWSGVLPDHTGFQRAIPIAAGPEISARLERLVDRELDRHLRQLERRHRKRLSKASASTARTGHDKIVNRRRNVHSRRQMQ